MNHVEVEGNLARDPVVRSTKTGKAVAAFTVAVNREFVTPQGEKKEMTDWINVVAWGNLAERVGNTCRKGMQVFAQGRYTTRSYDDQSGQRKWVTEVTAEFIGVPLTEVAARGSTQAGGYQEGTTAGNYNNATPASGYSNAAPRGGYSNAAPVGGFAQFGSISKGTQPMSQGAPFPAGEEEIPF